MIKASSKGYPTIEIKVTRKDGTVEYHKVKGKLHGTRNNNSR